MGNCIPFGFRMCVCVGTLQLNTLQIDESQEAKDSLFGWIYVLYSNGLDRDKLIALLKNKLLVSCYYISFRLRAHEISFFFFLPFSCNVRSLHVDRSWNGVRMWSAVVPFGRRKIVLIRSVCSALWLLLLIPVYHYIYLSLALDVFVVVIIVDATVLVPFTSCTQPLCRFYFYQNRMQEVSKCKYDCVTNRMRRSKTFQHWFSLRLSREHTHMRSAARPRRPSLAPASPCSCSWSSMSTHTHE